MTSVGEIASAAPWSVSASISPATSNPGRAVPGKDPSETVAQHGLEEQLVLDTSDDGVFWTEIVRAIC